MSGHDEKQQAGATTPASFSKDPYSRPDPPTLHLSLRPYRSLSVTGFQRVIILVSIGLAIPLVPFLGTPFAWALLPYLLISLLALYVALMRSYRDADLHEELRLWPDLITVERFEPRGAVHRWHANPYWVTPQLYRHATPENYLTLKGNGREIELGAFLSPEERADISDRLVAALNRVR